MTAKEVGEALSLKGISNNIAEASEMGHMNDLSAERIFSEYDNETSHVVGVRIVLPKRIKI